MFFLQRLPIQNGEISIMETFPEKKKNRAVKGSDYSPAIALSEEKDKLV